MARPSGPSASRRATDRPCTRAYVVTPLSPPGTTLPDLRLAPLATATQPTAVAFDPTRPGHGALAERIGRVVAVDGDTVDTSTVLLDLVGDTFKRGDGGLTGLTYSPDGKWLYVYRTRLNFTERITVYPVVDGRPQQDKGRVVIDIPHPRGEQHHGGGIAFGPDGYLYLSTGDGGGLGDPRGNGQRLSTVLGKLLRIEPTPEGDRPYRIPPDNPFVDREGARAEIYAYGLRNPFRLSFDPETNDLWLTDVGQSCWEELNRVPLTTRGGWNFGWDHLEGTHPFQGGAEGDEMSPLYDYSHLGGWCVIVGGFVYRGDAIPELDGAYLFTDYCKGKVVALRDDGRGPITLEDFGLRLENPVAIVEDPDGEPWILSLEGEVSRIVPRR